MHEFSRLLRDSLQPHFRAPRAESDASDRDAQGEHHIVDIALPSVVLVLHRLPRLHLNGVDRTRIVALTARTSPVTLGERLSWTQRRALLTRCFGDALQFRSRFAAPVLILVTLAQI